MATILLKWETCMQKETNIASTTPKYKENSVLILGDVGLT